MAELTMLAALSRVAINLLGTQPDKNSQNANTSAIADINARSLLELGRLTEVEAITIIDSSLTVHESTTDVLKFLNSLYASWYLSAASVITDTGRIKTVQLLSKLNPSKSPSYNVANSILSVAEKAIGNAVVQGISNAGPNMLSGFGMEAIDVTPANAPLSLPRTSSELEVSMEAVQQANQKQDNKDDKNTGDKTPATGPAPNYVGGFRAAPDLATVASLSLGQAVTLNVTDGKASKDVVVNIRLVTVPTTPRILSTILTWSDKDLRLKSRLSAWRAGELRFWRDVVLMRDVFTERQRLLMDDRSELFRSLLGRQRNSMINAVLTAQPDVGNMSSILVISQDTLRRIEETELNGRISNFTFRQQIMSNTGLVLIAVVDPLSELVTIYNHTKALPTEASIRQLKAAGKGGASDLGELVKLMNQSKMPSYM